MAKPRSNEQLAQTLRKAIAAHQGGDLAGALAAYTKYLKSVPHDGETVGLLAVVKFQQGFPVAALDLMQRACKLAPGAIGLNFNHAKMLVDTGRHAEAEPVLRRCLAIDARFHRAADTLGRVMLETGRPAEAIECFKSAISLEPANADYHVNLATALSRLYLFKDEALALSRACELAPDDIEIRMALAKSHYGAQRMDDSTAQYQHVLERDPLHPGAIGGLLLARLRSCQWQGLGELRERFAAALVAPQSPAARSRVPSPYVATLISNDPAVCLAAARIASSAHATGPALRRSKRSDRPRIRVGYLSADYREHATAYLASELIESHDRAQFEIVGISYGPDDRSPMRRRMEAAFDRFEDAAACSAAEMIARVRALDLDIAVDLQGFNQFNRMEVLAARVAPIQALYLGWPGTSGAGFYDYVIADPIVIPPQSLASFSESVAWLPGPYQCNDRKRSVAAEAPSRAACGLPEAGVVFSCFNNPFKILPEIFDVWMRILAAVPGSVLWLLSSTPEAESNLRAEATARGVAPERIVMAPFVANAEHLARHRHIDLVLDTLPYNAHTTASDALWQGIPVLTRTGTSFAGRVATSLLEGCGMPELITATVEDYERTAVALARDPATLAAIKAKLAAQLPAAPLFDTPRLTRHIELAYAEMKARHDRGEPPSLLDVRELAAEP